MKCESVLMSSGTDGSPYDVAPRVIWTCERGRYVLYGITDSANWKHEPRGTTSRDWADGRFAGGFRGADGRCGCCVINSGILK